MPGRRVRNNVGELTPEMQAFALRLRRDGHTYERIGEMLGTQFNKDGAPYSSMWAHKLVHRAIKDIFREEANDLIRLEMQRLDDMQLEALEVLRTEHVLVSAGEIVTQYLRDANGNVLFDQSTGKPATVPIRDDGPRLAAIDRLLKIQERRAKLVGLDKPTKVAPTNPEGTKPAQPFMIVANKEDIAL